MGKISIISFWLWLFSVNYASACYRVQYPASPHYPHEGIVCVIYNFSPWIIKVLPLGEPLSPWISSYTEPPGREVFPGSNDPLLIASPPIIPHMYKFFCLPLKQLSGLKFHVIRQRSTGESITKEFGLYNTVKDFTIFVLHQSTKLIPSRSEDKNIEKHEFFDVHGLNDDRLLHLGRSGASIAGASVAWTQLKHSLQHMPLLAHWLICQKTRRCVPGFLQAYRTRRVPHMPTTSDIPLDQHTELDEGANESVVPPLLSTAAVTAMGEEGAVDFVDGWISSRSNRPL